MYRGKLRAVENSGVSCVVSRVGEGSARGTRGRVARPLLCISRNVRQNEAAIRMTPKQRNDWPGINYLELLLKVSRVERFIMSYRLVQNLYVHASVFRMFLQSFLC